jgi:hypothetical protein
MADIEARVNENSPIGFFTWCWTIVVEITDGRIGSKAPVHQTSALGQERTVVALEGSIWTTTSGGEKLNGAG